MIAHAAMLLLGFVALYALHRLGSSRLHARLSAEAREALRGVLGLLSLAGVASFAWRIDGAALERFLAVAALLAAVVVTLAALDLLLSFVGGVPGGTLFASSRDARQALTVSAALALVLVPINAPLARGVGAELAAVRSTSWLQVVESAGSTARASVVQRVRHQVRVRIETYPVPARILVEGREFGVGEATARLPSDTPVAYRVESLDGSFEPFDGVLRLRYDAVHPVWLQPARSSTGVPGPGARGEH